MKQNAPEVKKLIVRLRHACTPQTKRYSENHWTAKTWLIFFENLNFPSVFDTSGNSANERPDIQVWFQADSKLGPDMWIEAKPPRSFARKKALEEAIKEVLRKIKNCLRNNEPLPSEIMFTDFHDHFIWDSSSFLTFLETFEIEGFLMKNLGKHLDSFTLSNPTTIPKKITDMVSRGILKSKHRIEEQSPLNLDSLIKELLAASLFFKKDYVAMAVKTIKKNSYVNNLFNEWLDAGGSLTIHMIAPQKTKRNIGAEQAFAELCFHNFMVRCFVIKWFIDHGLLNDTECAENWGLLTSESSSETWKSCLSPSGKDNSEKMIRETFVSSDVYLWVVDCAPSKLWIKIKSAFSRYSLVAEKSDILGEFYQKYMQAYEKKAQMALGQFYTPHTLTRAMWKLAAEVLRIRSISLADESCLVIDPCVGTGTFLTQGLRLLLDGSWGDTKRVLKGHELSEIAKRFTGFEVNQLSRGVAVVNCLTELLAHSSDGSKTLKPKLRIFETNAYDIPGSSKPELFSKYVNDESENEDLVAWRREVATASKAKRKGLYRIVIGNPPWRNPSPACKDERLQEMLQNDIVPWATNYKGDRLSDIKGCHGGVRDDYIFFMGLAVRLMSDRGLLVYVTNDSWLSQPTYTLVRRFLLDNLKIHCVVRLGPYFKGVKERASVVIAEKTDSAGAGRSQEIRYLDWSDLSNPNWSVAWVNANLERILSGKVKSSEWVTIKAVGNSNAIRVEKETAYKSSLPGCVSIESLFTNVKTGVQSGCGPIFMNTNKDVLINRVELLFEEKTDKLLEEIEGSIKGGRDKARSLIHNVVQKIRDNDVEFDEDAIRPILAHFSSTSGARKYGFCYFDPRLWLYPKVKRLPPDILSFWDVAPKLVFRDLYDPDDKVIRATVDLNGLLIDNHFFNGGVYIALVKDENGNTLLTDKGKKLREKFKSDEQFLLYLSAILNSTQVDDWSKANPGERVFIPTNIEASIARRMADLEKRKIPKWQSLLKDSGSDKRKSNISEDIFEKYLRKLSRTA